MEHIGRLLEREVGLEPKAIPTEYRGIKYRSRLEARWAVFLDELGIEHLYEFEGFQLGAGWYVPDFWLPQHRTWLELKGADATVEERKLCEQLCVARGERVLLASGAPDREMWLTVFAPVDGGESFCDEPWCFTETKGGAIGVHFQREANWSKVLEEASRRALSASFWNPL